MEAVAEPLGAMLVEGIPSILHERLYQRSQRLARGPILPNRLRAGKLRRFTGVVDPFRICCSRPEAGMGPLGIRVHRDDLTGIRMVLHTDSFFGR